MKAAIGQDSHRFEEGYGKPLILGGVVFPGETGLLANSDGDVVLHAITNAISGITGRNILGRVADEMCQSGITDSAEYLREALKSLEGRIVHLSISMECLRPKISPMIPAMQEKIAELLGVEPAAIGITATTGEGLTDCGKGWAVLCGGACQLTTDHAKGEARGPSPGEPNPDGDWPAGGWLPHHRVAVPKCEPVR